MTATPSRPSFLGAASAVYRKELRVAFLSPIAWVFLAAFLFISGLFFVMGITVTGEASLRPLVSNLAVVLLFCLPMLTMRQFAEETRSGTIELLMSAPVPLGSLILGKWAATLSLCAMLLLMTAAYPVVLWMYGSPDIGAMFTTYVGLFLCCAAFSSAGLFTSTLSRDQMVSGVGGILLLLPSWMASVGLDSAPPWLAPMLLRVSFLDHLRSFARGVLAAGDIGWFTAVTALFLFLTWQSLESRRWR